MGNEVVERYDIVIVGSGLGGLASGLILAMEGKSVCILEKNAQIGGALQTFRRDGVKFDTGVHYVGSLEEGQPLYPYFNYLGIMKDLDIDKMDVDGFDKISIGNDTTLYPHAQGFENFTKQLLVHFPEEKKGLEKYIHLIRETCKSFSLYNLEEGSDIEKEIDLFGISAKEVINSCTTNKKLQAVLGGINVLYAGNGDRAPFYIHALIANHYLLSSYRFPLGGDQISKLLEKKLRSFGAKIMRNADVESLQKSEGLISSAILKDGRKIEGDIFISNIHPKETLQLFNAEGIRKSYVNRVNKLENTTSCFILYLVFKEKSLPYQNHNIYHFESTDVWNSNNNSGADWGKDYAVFFSKSRKNPTFCESMSIISYMDFEEVNQWKETSNVRHQQQFRGDTYESFKEKKAELLLEQVSKIMPDIRDHISTHYTSTPLTQRDYLNVSDGSLYGIERNFNHPLNSYINTQTKVKNLYLTGQNIIMHGILGVTIGAVVTCSEIVGKSYLLNKIKAANKE